MELRPELLPPKLDDELVARLAELADTIDGARPGEWEKELEEFNRLAGTSIPFLFQGIYGGESHDEWVRRVLLYESTKLTADVTREELIEIVRRIISDEFFNDRDAYMALFDVNVGVEGAAMLLFDPPGYDQSTNTWGGGRRMDEYDPTPEEVVDMALEKRSTLKKLNE
ncbi:MAG: hypothetical protein KDA86_24390 [Planctomycetaceae bacterium]|nr:hypothetical protein [Planctomycetaceae bacterium]MCA9111555.1 hypothetical protein [Planctomycetaceae bacterium]